MTGPTRTGNSRDPWSTLAGLTPARIALGRIGASQPTRAVLDFALAHAQARDAVHAPFDTVALARTLAALGLQPIEVASRAPQRQVYLQRPDLGRRLSDASRARLEAAAGSGCDVGLVIGDGLSATAVGVQAPPLLRSLLPHLGRLGLTVGPVCLAEGARVALGDEIGAILRARLAVVLIGERPGLSAPDSLGVYITYDPRPGRNDAERNCISNVRPAGLAPDAAAARLTWLIAAAFERRLTGVALKDESDAALDAPGSRERLPG